MIPLRKSDKTYEQRENLNPGMSYYVKEAPPTTCLC